MVYLWEYLMKICKDFEVDTEGITLSITDDNKLLINDKFTLGIGDNAILFARAGVYYETKLESVDENEKYYLFNFSNTMVEEIPKNSKQWHSAWLLIGKLDREY